MPVINGLTDTRHPCQLMADVLTFEEHRGPIAGSGRRLVRRRQQRRAQLDRGGGAVRLHAAAGDARANCARRPSCSDWARAEGASDRADDDPAAAVAGARCVVTDTWVSMSDDPNESRHNLLAPYRVTPALMAQAAPDAMFMHCLPAHRGEEVTAAVIDGPQSVVFDEAENRLHAQKGVLAWALGAAR